MDRERFDELKRKAAGEGLTDEEAGELGRLYAEDRGVPYQDSSSVSDAGTAPEDQDTQQRREQDAGSEAQATEERDRAQAIPPGEAREPDYDDS